MNGLKKGCVQSDIGAGRDSQATDESSAQIRNDIAIQIWHEKDVVLLGLLHELHAHVVDQHLLKLDVGIACRHHPGRLEEEAVGVLHDVRLRNCGDLAALVAGRVVKGEARNALGSAH